MNYVVETTDLTKKFGRTPAVSNVELRIEEGEIYGFLGPNGAGKSTTIRMLLGLMQPTFGLIKLFGKDLKHNRLTLLKKIGALVETPSYYPHLTAYENLEICRKILAVPKQRIDDVLKMVRLYDTKDKKVKGFSLGMKQRLGIAAAMLHEPRLLILDEPTNGLDPSGILELRQLLNHLAKAQGITILISSHLLSEIDQLATTVGVLDHGKLLFQGSIERLRETAQTSIFLTIEPLEAAFHFLTQNDYQPQQQDNCLQIPFLKNEQIAALIKRLVEENFSIYRVEEEKQSLEAIFLSMTKKEPIR
ncbi:ATP-binding cassette domain-containing protein [Erwinia sp. CPCC 100877]|nr:ATP-binding cassette domain-containing protein [Erwinia sp. CPCC 100877]